jgi:hypothetical protein
LASSRHTQRTVGYASRAAPRLPGHPQKSETLRTNQNQTLLWRFPLTTHFQMAKNKKPGDTWSLKTE